MEPNNRHINWELLEKHFAGKTSPEEETALTHWLEADPVNKTQYNKLKIAFRMAGDTLRDADAAGGPKKAPVFDAEADWKAMKARIKPQAKIISNREKSSRNPFNMYWLAAAVAVVLVGLAYLFFRPGTSTPMMVTVTTQANEKKEVNLPDGSKVTLAGASTLTYPEKFDPSGRVVNLKGMAYFVVARDTRYTFTAFTPKSSVTVLGTQFLLKGGDTPSVQVAIGSVKFASRKNPEAALVLKKGEQAILEKEAATPEKIAADPNDLSWKTGKLVFQGWALGDIVEELENHFNVAVEVEDPEILSQTFTARVSSESVSKAFEELADAADFSVVANGDSILLK